MDATAPKLAVSQLSKRFNSLEVLRSISVDVNRGEFISIVGPSGCGKTTFLRIVGGLEQATSGAALLDGRKITGPGMDRGFVFQQDNLLPWRTIESNVNIGLEINNKLDRAQKERTTKLLNLVGLRGFADYYPRQLSGGMRQRVNLARALAVDPELLLMDEPSEGLAPVMVQHLEDIIRQLREAGIGILLVEQNLYSALAVADDVYLIETGEIVYRDKPDRLRRDQAALDRYLGVH